MIASLLADYLEDQGLGTVATDIFVGYLPSQPDTALAVYPYQGPAPDVGLPYDHPNVQLRSRSSDPQLAYSRLMDVYSALHGLHHITLGTTWVTSVTALQSEPASLGRDEAGRDEYTLNFQLRVRRDTAHRSL